MPPAALVAARPDARRTGRTASGQPDSRSYKQTACRHGGAPLAAQFILFRVVARIGSDPRRAPGTGVHHDPSRRGPAVRQCLRAARSVRRPADRSRRPAARGCGVAARAPAAGAVAMVSDGFSGSQRRSGRATGAGQRGGARRAGRAGPWRRRFGHAGSGRPQAPLPAFVDGVQHPGRCGDQAPRGGRVVGRLRTGRRCAGHAAGRARRAGCRPRRRRTGQRPADPSSRSVGAPAGCRRGGRRSGCRPLRPADPVQAAGRRWACRGLPRSADPGADPRRIPGRPGDFAVHGEPPAAGAGRRRAGRCVCVSGRDARRGGSAVDPAREPERSGQSGLGRTPRRSALSRRRRVRGRPQRLHPRRRRRRRMPPGADRMDAASGRAAGRIVADRCRRVRYGGSWRSRRRAGREGVSRTAGRAVPWLGRRATTGRGGVRRPPPGGRRRAGAKGRRRRGPHPGRHRSAGRTGRARRVPRRQPGAGRRRAPAARAGGKEAARGRGGPGVASVPACLRPDEPVRHRRAHASRARRRRPAVLSDRRRQDRSLSGTVRLHARCSAACAVPAPPAGDCRC